jgi:hypothetical protein
LRREVPCCRERPSVSTTRSRCLSASASRSKIHEWSLDDPTDDVFWQAGYKPEPPISDEERLRWMAANAADDAERKAKEAGQSFDRDGFIAEYRDDMLRRCAEAKIAAAEQTSQRPEVLAGTTSSPADTDA